MSAPVFLTREYHGLLGPPGTQIPSPVDLLRLCTVEHPERYSMGLAYPPGAPVLWIKYGRSVIWNEVVAQAMAHKELRGLQSQVKAPAVFYACEMELPRRNGSEWLVITKRKHRVESLSREPIVFCYSDVWLGNFLIDEDNHVTVIDFADCSILPSSFSKFGFSASQTKIKRDISELVTVPTTDSIDNTLALCVAKAPMVMGPRSYASSSRRLLGNGTEEKDDRIHLVVRYAQGSPIIDVPREVLKTPGYEKSLSFVDLPPLSPPPPRPWD
ncbi:hypothetical protein EDB80DRAFT_891202 [Ilyonectria destructans]|nr:hypothetical protein EDB80DRAFT_891202 [Ilyonectria destructans]